MNNTDIREIYRLLNTILELQWPVMAPDICRGCTFEVNADTQALILGNIQQALALLPCNPDLNESNPK